MSPEGPGGSQRGSAHHGSLPTCFTAHVSCSSVAQRRIFTVVPGPLAGHERPSINGRSVE